ncbi:MAG: hypothetical protein HDS62_06690 [Bacteroidales bacterium]|nr:hypothetical protein [Bacteroidales bacterium]
MKTLDLSKKELRSIRGGAEPNEGFPCKVINENGDESLVELIVNLDAEIFQRY